MFSYFLKALQKCVRARKGPCFHTCNMLWNKSKTWSKSAQNLCNFLINNRTQFFHWIGSTWFLMIGDFCHRVNARRVTAVFGIEKRGNMFLGSTVDVVSFSESNPTPIQSFPTFERIRTDRQWLQSLGDVGEPSRQQRQHSERKTSERKEIESWENKSICSNQEGRKGRGSGSKKN